MRQLAILFVLILGGCVLAYGGDGQKCYPNSTCDNNLVCVRAKLQDYPSGICMNPTEMQIDGKSVTAKGKPTCKDGGTP